MNLKEFITGYRGKDIPKELKGFNWAAFLLTFIWGIRFKAWITLLAIPLIWFQLPFGVNWLLLTALQIYCGIKGNEWAYQVEWWKKATDFRNAQTKWAIAAFSVHIIIPVVLLCVLGKFLQKTPDNPILFAKNSLCAISYDKINAGLSKTTFNSTSTEIQIASDFAKQFNNTLVEDNRVYFTQKSSGHTEKLYAIIFTKHGQNCSIAYKNCQIRTELALSEYISNIGDCDFYFDDNKNIEPTNETKEALKKGYNIFKYL